MTRDPRPEDLPEVQALMAEGWEPLEEIPYLWNLPSVWPAEHVTSVPDTLPRYSTVSDGETTTRRPWTDEDRAFMSGERAAMARRAGLEPLPDGRLWLLRSPWPSLGLETVIMVLLVQQIRELGLQQGEQGALRAARVLLTRGEEELWDWFAPEPDHPARQWRALGRTGRDVAALIVADLRPDDVRRLAAPLPDGAGLTEQQMPHWILAVGWLGREAVDRVITWRRLGLPADPPDHVMMLGEDPYEYAAWAAAGFGIDDAEALVPAGLDRAILWRDAGFGAVETIALLNADHTLTPDEARAFEAAGITGRHRIAWVEAGFDAAAAVAWREVDVLPNEARLWRAAGLGPADAAGVAPVGGDLGDARLPPGHQGGWVSWSGSEDPAGQRAARQYGVQDPPGTRGRLAEEEERRRSRGPGRDYLP